MLSVLYGLGYGFTILGSLGMIAFAMRFPFSTSLRDLKYHSARFLRMNGYVVWIVSWVCILIGAVFQLFASIASVAGADLVR